jgi:hypothetical protein
MSGMCLMSRLLSHKTPNIQRFMDLKQHCRFREKETLKSMFFAGLTILQFKCFDNDNPACSSHCRIAVSIIVPIATANVNVPGQSYLELGHRLCGCLKVKLPGTWDRDFLHLTLVLVVIES